MENFGGKNTIAQKLLEEILKTESVVLFHKQQCETFLLPSKTV